MPDAPKKQLTLFDSTCLIVGIIIGAGIYQMAPDIAKGAFCWWGVLLIWVVGGLISLCGAVGYAELATGYPKEGGDYVFLSRAYGRWAGFLFGWLQLAVIRPGDIVLMAFAFATYACAIGDPLAGTPFPYGEKAYAAAAVIALTAINMIGVRQGKWTQNVLTTVKALGLLAIVGVALMGPKASDTAELFDRDRLPVSVAFVLVLFTFGGWNDMAYVAAEVKDSRRNILRAMVLGITAVTLLYVLVNGAFLYSLGYQGLATSDQVATDSVRTVLPKIGGNLISALVCISALGAVNGLIFTGARISYAVGADHPAFGYFGKWYAQTGTPLRALLIQCLLALVLVVTLGSFVKTILYTSPAVYLFYLATSLAVIVLRWREPQVERPYRVTGYPVTTLLFAAVCGYLIYSCVNYAIFQLKEPWIIFVPFAIMLFGIPLYLWSNWLGTRPAAPDKDPRDS